MAGVRKALIVATDEYSDPKLTRLNAPLTDARALAEVLRDQNVGVFEVETVLNQECQEVRVALARFLKAGKRGDTLLIHFSCHGVKDLSGELYFATPDTDLLLLEDTAVSSARVRAAIDDSSATLILCFIDCCYAGAFTQGVRDADTIDLTDRLGGQGRAVITAGTSMQLVLDGKETASVFTRAVVDGLSTGDADLDLDGLVSLDEFYSFVHDRVTAENPHQTPVKSFEVRGDVYVARRGGPVTTPAPLPQKLLDILKHGEDFERRGAVTKLAEYLVKGHPGRAVAARTELERLRDNDVNLLVREDAVEALAAAGAQADLMPEIPPYDPGPEPKPPRPTPDWKVMLAVAAAVALAVLLVVGSFLVFGGDDTDDGDDGDRQEGKKTDLAQLPEDELLMGLDVDGQHTVVAVNATSGDLRVLSTDDDMFLPTLSQDRRQMVFLQGTTASTRTPVLAAVDGSDPENLVSEDSDVCEHSRRPAQSVDGSAWAMVCNDGEGDTEGLFVVGEDGMPRQLDAPEGVTGAPTWTDGGEVIFMVEEADGRTTLWQVPGDGGGPASVLEGVEASSAGSPDWSPGGLLYLGSDQASDVGDVYLHKESGEDVPVTGAGTVEAPNWSPDGRQIAYLAPDGGALVLWVKGTDLGAQRRPVEIAGEPGPPAWGAR